MGADVFRNAECVLFGIAALKKEHLTIPRSDRVRDSESDYDVHETRPHLSPHRHRLVHVIQQQEQVALRVHVKHEHVSLMVILVI